ncbi:DEAD/DEAH box helicase [Sutterella sp.]|uniref:DEAD/DEAH box helicase n=1 Tax=Sutterella sp. TaxID=1981025 RepID=UPI0026E0E42D|nr:DEAD/DEAH box helicase [Sutterella sp.]
MVAGNSERFAILALSIGVSGWINWATTRQSHSMDVRDRFEGLLVCNDHSGADGWVQDWVGPAYAQGLRHYMLAGAYPWQTVFALRFAAGRVLMDFGILSHDADLRRVRAAVLGMEDAGAPSAGDARPPVEGELPTDRPVFLPEILSDERYRPHRLAAIGVLRSLSEYFPAAARLLENRGASVEVEPSEIRECLFDTVPQLSLLGVAVIMPRSFRRLLRPRLLGFVSGDEGFARHFLSREALADFDWRAAIGDTTLSREEFLALADKYRGKIIPWEGKYVFLDEEEIDRIRGMLINPPRLTQLEKIRAVLQNEYMGMPLELDDAVRMSLREITEVKDVPPPEGLRATLRPYQERGFSWLMKNMSLGIGALIADDMGLGKTVQVISAILELKNRGELEELKVLVVVPTTIITNWLREIARFAPSLTRGVYHGLQRELPPPGKLPDVTITSYGTLRQDFALLVKHHWKLLVIDEAQAIKNVSTAQAEAVRGLKADQVIAMTGTPVENRLLEYWSILSTVQPRILGTKREFEETFVKPIEADHDEKTAEAFRRLTAPFMLRRLKTDKAIIADLPEKTVIDHFVTLRPEQAALYEKTLRKDLADIESAKSRIARKGRVLKLITSLKQICNSPSQFLKTRADAPDSGKGDALLEIINECRDADRKVIIFTQYVEMGERLQRWIGAATDETPSFVHGSLTLYERQRIVDRFQEDRSAKILILTLKVGGTGLNLTAASAVIHYDLWWNPAVEDQATDRAFRIGQQRDVLVYRMITAGTFEERINEMLQAKRSLAEMTVATGEQWIGDLPVEELRKLFELTE